MMRAFKRMVEMRLLITVVVLLASPGLTFAGPFGLEMGMKKGQLSSLELTDTGDYMYTTKQLPKNHSAFLLYGLVIHPETGLCMIKAIGKSIDTSSYGEGLRGKFDQITEQLGKAYGEAEVRDFLRYDSIWDEPKDFMTGLRKGERVLQAIWGDVNGPEIKDGVFEILLTADATSSDEGQLSLQYRFANHERCQDLIESEEADAF